MWASASDVLNVEHIAIACARALLHVRPSPQLQAVGKGDKLNIENVTNSVPPPQPQRMNEASAGHTCKSTARKYGPYAQRRAMSAIASDVLKVELVALAYARVFARRVITARRATSSIFRTSLNSGPCAS